MFHLINFKKLSSLLSDKPFFSKVLRSIIITCFAIAAGFIISGLSLHVIEAYLYDFRFRAKPRTEDSKHIALIMINKSTVQTYNQIPSLEKHRELLEKISGAAPKATVYSMKIEDIKATSQEKVRFTAQAEKLSNLFEITEELQMRGETSHLTLKDDLKKIRLLSGPPTADKKSFAQDGVTRRMMFSYQDQLMIHPLLASLYNPDALSKEKVRGLFPWIDSDQLYIQYRNPGSFPSYSFEQVLSPEFDLSVFKDRLIIIGTDLQQDPKDYFQTPFSREISAMTLAEVQANMFGTLIDNSAPIKAPDWLNVVFTVLISVLTVHVVFNLETSHWFNDSWRDGFRFYCFFLFRFLALWHLDRYVPPLFSYFSLLLLFHSLSADHGEPKILGVLSEAQIAFRGRTAQDKFHWHDVSRFENTARANSRHVRCHFERSKPAFISSA